jgi:hypothetical protein
VAELTSGCGVSLGELLGVGSVCVSLGESLLPIAVDADEDGTNEPGDGDGGLDNVEQVDRSWPTVGSGT